MVFTVRYRLYVHKELKDSVAFWFFEVFGSYLQLFALAGLLSIRLGSSWMKAQSIGLSYAISGGTAMPRATRIETRVL